MSYRLVILPVILALGCSDSSSYSIVGLEEKNIPAQGIQHRCPRVVVLEPESKQQVEVALRDIYQNYKQEIEGLQPDAPHKRISILLYDSVADAEDHDGYHICHVTGNSIAGPILPEWEDVEIDWKWRDPKYRPTPDQLKLFTEYWRGQNQAFKDGESLYFEAKGNNTWTLEDQPGIEKSKKAEVIKVVQALCKRNGMSQAELGREMAYVWLWKLGEQPTDERVKEWSDDFHKDWTE